MCAIATTGQLVAAYMWDDIATMCVILATMETTIATVQDATDSVQDVIASMRAIVASNHNPNPKRRR